MRTERLSFHRLHVFKRVVELQSASKTAEEFFISQPAVSDILRALETAVGDRLITWSERRPNLTPHGQVLYDLAVSLLARTSDAARLLDGINSGAEGSVVVGSTSTIATYMLPPAIIEASRTRPQIQYVIEVFPTTSILTAVLDGECDFGVVMFAAAQATAQIERESLGWEEIILIAPPGERTTPNSFNDLTGLRFVCAPRTQIVRVQLDEMLAARGVTARDIRLELSHPEAVKKAVMAGIGPAFVYRCTVAEELARRSVVEVPLPGPPLRTGTELWSRKGRRFTVAQTQLMDDIRQSLSKQ